MKIESDVIRKISISVDGLLQKHSEDISAAMIDGDDTVSISMPVKMVKKGSELIVQVGINFVRTRVKDEAMFTVSDQAEIPFEGEREEE